MCLFLKANLAASCLSHQPELEWDFK